MIRDEEVKRKRKKSRNNKGNRKPSAKNNKYHTKTKSDTKKKKYQKKNYQKRKQSRKPVDRRNLQVNNKSVNEKKVLAIDNSDKELIEKNVLKEKDSNLLKKAQTNSIDFFIIAIVLFLSSIFITIYSLNSKKNNNVLEIKQINVEKPTPSLEPVIEIIPEPKEEIIEITTAGDCTLGADTKFGYNGQFDWWFKNKAKGNYGYFFEKVKYLFANDDFSYVNLEGTLTTSKKKTEKKYNFKGDPKYTNILISGGIEGVNIANNHSNDYGTVGYNHTKKYLKEAGIDYFGHDSILIKEIKGKKIAFIGYTGVGLWTDKDKDMANTIKKLKSDGVDLVIANFHWGIEYAHAMSSTQRKRAHLAIDSGADIVIGSHPHCLQGMEKYKGKYIVYSLGNFVFGGNSNPKAIGRDCIIVKMFIHYVDDKLEDIKLKVIPCSISSTKSRNNYQPVVASGSEYKRMIKVINKYSINYKYKESEN